MKAVALALALLLCTAATSSYGQLSEPRWFSAPEENGEVRWIAKSAEDRGDIGRGALAVGYKGKAYVDLQYMA